MIKQIGSVEDNIFQRNNNYEAISAKYIHLTDQNTKLRQTIEQLERQIKSLRTINTQMMSGAQKNLQVILSEITQQNYNLQQALFRSLKANQQLSCDLLMKKQLLIQGENQHQQIVTNYENKIYQLRTSMQAKQAFVSNVEDKMMMEREESYNIPSRANLAQLNQAMELRHLLDRYTAENTELQLLNVAKSEELQICKNRLKLCQKALRNGESWQSYNGKGQVGVQQEKTKIKQQDLKLKLQEQLTRYYSKYRYISVHQNKSNTSGSQVHNLKLMISRFFQDKQHLIEDNSNLYRIIYRKDQQLKIFKKSFREMERQIQQLKIQIQFYKSNFKELSKVTTQRKIKYYDQYYYQILPELDKMLHERASLINYWKQWHSANSDRYNQRRFLFKNKKKVTSHSWRSNSCSTRFNIFRQTQRKVCSDNIKQNFILSFLGQTHNMNSMLGYTFEEKVHQKVNIVDDEQLFDEDISIIDKPTKIFKKEKSVHPRQIVFQL